MANTYTYASQQLLEKRKEKHKTFKDDRDRYCLINREKDMYGLYYLWAWISICINNINFKNQLKKKV